MQKKLFFSHFPAVSIPLLCIILHLFWPDGTGPLMFVNSIDWLDHSWRLVTAPLLHTNTNHLLMNLAAYGLIYSFSHESLTSWRMPVVTLVCGTLSTLGFALSPSELSSLVGLSGALHGCLIYLAFCEWKQSPKLMSATIVLVLVKVAWEQTFGAPAHTAELIGASVAIWSHLTGVIAGALLAVSRLTFLSNT